MYTKPEFISVQIQFIFFSDGEIIVLNILFDFNKNAE